MNIQKNKISRRTFIKTTSAFAGMIILPKTVFGANERLNVAFVGVGGKGIHAIKSLINNEHMNIVSFADVDDKKASEAYQLKPKVPRYRDYRVMLDKHDKQIDAVIVSTPDHTHHCIAMKCMEMGKHVYLEKPLAHNISEVRDLIAAEKKYNLACQMGNQGHSGPGIPLLRAWYEAGVLGEVNELQAWCNPAWGKGDISLPKPEDVPATLDWNLWLGPATFTDYSSKYCPAKWRGWNAFGNGSLGDWACHNMDAPYDVFELDCPSSVKIESTGPSKYSFPESTKLIYTFPGNEKRGEIKLKWFDGKVYSPERPSELEEGRKFGNNWGGTIITGSNATVMMGSHAGSPRIIPETKHREIRKSLPEVKFDGTSHFDNWLLSCKGEGRCKSSFAYGGRLTETMLFGLIAAKLNRDLKIDPVKRMIIEDDEADKLMSWPEPRKGW